MNNNDHFTRSGKPEISHETGENGGRCSRLLPMRALFCGVSYYRILRPDHHGGGQACSLRHGGAAAAQLNLSGCVPLVRPVLPVVPMISILPFSWMSCVSWPYAKGIKPAEPRVPVFHQSFLDSIKHWGRAYEVGLIAGYKAALR